MKYYLAMDVGGTSIKYGVVNDQGKIINTDKIVTPDSLKKCIRQWVRFIIIVIMK